MQLNFLAVIPLLLSATAASPGLFQRAACNANNCYRAVAASSAKPGRTSAAADCSRILQSTVTACPSTTTSTVTVGVVATQGAKKREVPAQLEARAAACPTTNTPVTAIPTYASACSSFAAYSSACSCNGATGSVTTVTPTSTVTSTSTTTCASATGFKIQATGGAYSGLYVQNVPAYPIRLESDVSAADVFTYDASSGHINQGQYFLVDNAGVDSSVIESNFADSNSRLGLSCAFEGTPGQGHFSCVASNGASFFYVCPSRSAGNGVDPNSVYFFNASPPDTSCISVDLVALPVC